MRSSCLPMMIETMSGPILLTGAAGNVATDIRPFLARAGLELRLSDQRLPAALKTNEAFVAADLRDASAVARAAAGCAGIVHLGGIAKDLNFARLLDVDMRGVVNVLDAAVREGVPRVVLASSMHVLGFYGRDRALTPDVPPQPDSRYAVAKLFAEHAGALYVLKHGLRVTCLRLGHVTGTREHAEPGAWVAPDDVARLVCLGLHDPRIRFEIIHAVAPYAGDDAAQRDLERRLGFRFWHEGTTYADALEALTPYYEFEPRARVWRGGVFACRQGEPAE